jgi:UPF0755 protein
MIRRLLLALLVLVLLATGAVGTLVSAFKYYQKPGPLPESKVVVVPRGTPAELAEVLVKAGVLEDATGFRIAVSLTNSADNLKSGEFTFPEHASLWMVMGILRNGKPVQHKVTLPEGLTAYQIATLIARAPALDGDVPKFDEGAVFPDTYTYTYGAPRAQIVERGRAEMDKNLAKVWETRDPTIPLATPRQLLALASMIERETSRPEERPHVAAVYLNRLKQGMKLQSDPTVAYVASHGQANSERGITRAQLETPSPYNTYLVAGLPPGPIASPGMASLLAAAHPIASDDLYFVADGEGGHAFAKTLDEHNRNVAKYRSTQTR